MSRYRGYGNAGNARTYLSRRDEFTMSETEKNEAFTRRRKAAEAAAAAPKALVASTSLFAPMWPSPMSIMRFEAHGTPIPPPPEGYAGPIPEKYAAFIAKAVPAVMMDTEEEEEQEEAAESPSP